LTQAGVSRDASERRTNERFALRLPVTFRNSTDPQNAEVSSGTTLNISSNGLLFQTTDELKAGQRILVSIEWPVRLENRIPLNLVLHGRILRCEGGMAAMQTQRHEFKTRRAPSVPAGMETRFFNGNSAH